MSGLLTDHDELNSIRNVYALLSRIWIAEVDKPLLVALSTSPLRAAFTQMGGVIPERDQLEELAVDYCQLFIGPRDHLPPIQSVWERSQLQSEITDSVQAFADLFDYQLPSEHDGIVDHLGIELEMMATAMMIPSSEASAAATEFFVRHLTWPGRLLDASIQSAQSDFYKSVTQITKEFLRAESSAMNAK